MQQVTSLQRYRKFYKLEGGGQGTTKEELMPSVARHFAAQVCVSADPDGGGPLPTHAKR